MSTDGGELSLVLEVKPMTSGHIFKQQPDSMSLIEQVQAHVILKKLEDALKSRLGELRTPLMSIVETKGGPRKTKAGVDTGNKEYLVEGSHVVVEHRKSKMPDGEGLKKLLATKNIKPEECFDTVKHVELNASKLNFLVETGKLTKDEVEKLCPELLALRIYASKPLKEAVASLGMAKDDDAALTE